MSNKGGDHYMRGTYDKAPLEFALDLTDNIPSTDPDYCRYFLKIVRSARGRVKGEGSLVARSGTPVEHKYRGHLPQPLVDGENCFVIGLVPRYTVSCSSVRLATDTPLYMKTASGQKAKVTISRTGLNAKLQYTVTK